MDPYSSDNDTFQTFLSLKTRTNFISEFRDKLINEGRYQLLRKCFEFDWGLIGGISDANEDRMIKDLVKDYFITSVRMTNEGFILIYNSFQNKIKDAERILYYLNPLKFDAYTSLALSILQIDNKLDYSGFISACKVAKVEIDELIQLINRIGECKYTSKYNQIINKLRA